MSAKWLALRIVILGSAGAAPAQAAMTTPQQISPHGTVVSQSAVATGGGRTAVLMVVAPSDRPMRRSLQVRLGASGRLGSPQRLDGRDVDALRVAVGAKGTAVAAWMVQRSGHRRLVRAAIARPGHSFGAAQTIEQGLDVPLGGVAVSPTGRAVVAYGSGTSGLPAGAAIAEPGRPFGAGRALGPSPDWPAVAVAPDGTILVTWMQPPAAPSVGNAYRLMTTTLATNAAAFTPAAELTAIPTTDPPTLAIGPTAASGPGGAAVIWGRVPGVAVPGGSWRWTLTHTSVATLGGGGAFASPATLPPAPYTAGLGGDPRNIALGIPTGGSNVALWHETQVSNNEVTASVVRASTRPRGGTFSRASRLSAGGWLTAQPQAGALTDRTVASWAEYGRAGHRPRLRVAVRRVGHAWAQQPARSIPGLNPDSVVQATSPHEAIVTWVQGEGGPELGGRLYLTTYRPG